MKTSSQFLLTFLLNAAWQIVLITVVASLCAWLLRETSARYQHRLWVAALLLSLGLPVFTCLDVSFNRLFKRAAPAVTTAQPMMPTMPTVDDVAPIPLETPIPATTPSSFVPVSSNLSIGIFAVYLLFVCYRSINLWRAYRQTRLIANSAVSLAQRDNIQAIVEQCQAALGVTRVCILCSSVIPAPITVGSFHPMVILPERLLGEADRNVLLTAIGHELAHVRRRDYLLNLFYEFLSLPLSFHPAATLMKRRLKETRELSCDELVTDRLLEPKVYARSLVELARSAMELGRHSTISIGVADADILEERVMTILKRSTATVSRKRWLLLAATLCFVVPCAVATPFALHINITPRAAAVTAATPQDTQQKIAGSTLLAWIKKPGDTVERGEGIAKIDTGKGVIEVEAATSGVIERILLSPGEKVPANAAIALIREQGQEAARERNEAREARLKAQAELDSHRRAEGEPRDWAVTSSRNPQEARTVKVNTVDGEKGVTLAQDPQQEAREKEERRMKEARMREERAREERESQDPEIVAKRRAEREAMAKRQAWLAKEARITMQQAIQIATNQYPGTVLESRLVRERDQPWYILAILSDNGTETTATRVVMSAIDGSIMKQEQER